MLLLHSSTSRLLSRQLLFTIHQTQLSLLSLTISLVYRTYPFLDGLISLDHTLFRDGEFGHFGLLSALFVLAYVAVTGFSLPGAVILTLAGGFLFGFVWGTLFVNLGATTGATLAFLSSRYLLRDWVERKFGKWLGPVQQGFTNNAFSYLLTLRLIPLFPFFVVNLVSGLTRMNVGTYVVATALGIIPGSFVYAYAGRQLGTINSLKDIASPGVIGAFVLLGLLALVPSLYKKWSGKPA